MDKFLERSSSTESLSSKRTAEVLEGGWQPAKRTAIPKVLPNISKERTYVNRNRFSELPVDHSADLQGEPFRDASTNIKKIGHIPPIIVEIKPDWTHETIRSIVSKHTSRFHLQYRRNNKVAIVCYSPETHQAVKDGLRTDSVNYMTYTRKDEKIPKVVIRGLPAYVEPDLAAQLDTLGFKGAKITKLKIKEGDTTICPPYLVQLPAETDVLKFRQIKYLFNCVVTMQKYRPNRSLGTQCFRCQGFGHSSKNCNLPARCVKCAQPHPTSECSKKDRKDPAVCCNCNELHPANFHGCPVRKEYLNKIQERRNRERIAPRLPSFSKQAETVRHSQSSKNTESRSWANITKPKLVPTVPPEINPMADTQIQDPSILEMLLILKTLKNLKTQFMSCTSMLDKVLLVMSHLGQHV